MLIDDADAEWMRLAVPLVLEQDLAASPAIVAGIAANGSGAYQLYSSEAVRVTVEKRGGSLSLRAVTINLASQRVTNAWLSRDSPDLVTGLNALAKQIDRHASPFSSRGEAALKAFATGLSSPDPGLKAQRLRDAITADPSFGLAYLALIDVLRANSPAEMDSVLKQAEAHRASFTPVDRARFDLARSRALQAPVRQQAAAASSLLRLTPNDIDALAALASSLFLEGRAEEAERSMGRALQVSPGNASLRDQLARGLVETKQFAAAEKIFAGLAASNPSILAQVAACILLEGDTARADATYEKFLSSISNADTKVLLRSTWLALSGKRPEAVAQILAGNFSDARWANLARSQAVLWQVFDKRREEAKKIATGASAAAKLLADGAFSAAGWQNEVDRLPSAKPDDPAKLALLRYGFFLLGFYPESVEAWKQADTVAGGSDLRARTMLAASREQAGKLNGGTQVAVQPFLPDFSDYYDVVSFTEMRRLLR